MKKYDTKSFHQWSLQSLGIAVAYAVTGKLSLLFAIPPGYATAIWPPSGIALAFILVYGYRIWPGVLLGSFFVNASIGLDSSSAATVFYVPLGIGFGAALQAVVGAYCVRRFADFPNSLGNEREVFSLLFWGGLSCLVNSIIGSSVLVAAGEIPASSFLVNFGTWWIGDIVGVFIFTPLALVWVLRPRRVWNPRRLTVTLTITITFALTIAVVAIGANLERQQLKLYFDQQTAPFATALEKTLKSSIGVLHFLEGFYAASTQIDRGEFQAFVDRAFTELPGLQALSWNPRVLGRERVEFESSTRREGFPSFQITERSADGKLVRAANRPEYISVHFIEPFKGNMNAFGFDVASNPTRLEAMNQARDSGNPIATSRITLVQETAQQFGFLVFMPVYRKGLPHDTIENRRHNLVGYMVGVFRGGDIVKAALQDLDQEGLVYRLIDETSPTGEQFLFENRPQRQGIFTLYETGIFGGSTSIGKRVPVGFGGRQWVFEISPSQEFLAHNRQENTWLILISGMFLTSLVGALVMVMSGRRELLRNLVEERTGELKNSETRTRAIVDNVIDGIVTIDQKGTIETFNPAAEKLFCYAADEVIGKNIKCLMPEPYHSEHDGYLQNYHDTSEAKIIGIGREVIGQRKDGSTFPMELAVGEMEVSGIKMFTGIVRDITDRKQAENMKTEFVSTVSHELRTPLTSIKGSLGLVQSGALGELPDKLKSMIGIAYNNCDRLVRLINDILDIEKIAAGKMEFHLEAMDLVKLLEQAIESNKGYGEEHGVSFVLSSDLPEAKVDGDHDRLMQVMANLMSNAAKFSPDGESITISLSKHDPGYRIKVIDHGPGIPEEFRDKIFGKFHQADSSDTRSKGGTGLGLNITKAIVEQHGGSIGFESETGKGTTFFFDLPELQERLAVQRDALSKYHVLICEDEPDIATLLDLMLKKDGFTTDIAKNAAKAEDLLSKNTYDAMTLDLGLPDKDGITLLRELREKPETSDLPIIVISAKATEGAMEINGDAIGVIDWLEKPIDQGRLSESLHRAVASAPVGAARILHVEDDPDILSVVSALVADLAEVVPAITLSQAKSLLEQQTFDLVILDLMLPDGNGEDLLPLLKKDDHKSTPVIVFSAKDVSEQTADSIKSVLVKSRTSNESLLSTIRSSIEATKSTSE